MSAIDTEIPPPRAGDPPDVVEALNYAESHRQDGARDHMVGWLKEAYTRALSAGSHARASEILQAFAGLSPSKAAEAPVAMAPPQSAAPAAAPPAKVAPQGAAPEDVEIEFEEVDVDFDDADFEDFDEPPTGIIEEPADAEEAGIIEEPADAEEELVELDAGEEVEELEEDGLEFDELSISAAPQASEPAPDSDRVAPLAVRFEDGDLSFDDTSAAEYVNASVPPVSHDDTNALEEELGVDLSLNFGAASRPQVSATPEVSAWQTAEPEPHGEEEAPLSAPEIPSSKSNPWDDLEEDDPDAKIVGRASIHSRVPLAGRPALDPTQPFGMSPSAEMPAANESAADLQLRGASPSSLPPIEPPSRPSHAPAAIAMREPPRSNHPEGPDDSRPPLSLAGAPIPPASPIGLDILEEAARDAASLPPNLESHPPQVDSVKPLSVFAKAGAPTAPSSRAPAAPSSFAPTAPSSRAPAAASSLAPTAPSSRAPAAASVPDEPSAPAEASTMLDGIDFLDLEGLGDLPEEDLQALVARAEVNELSPREEVSGFAVALVLQGQVALMPMIVDATCALAGRGEVLFTHGSLSQEVAMRVVAAAPGTRVATIRQQDFDTYTQNCPWVADELRQVGDKFQALGGAMVGPLGASLDDMFRSMVLEKCSVKRFEPGQQLASAGKALDGLYILGVGELQAETEIFPGDVLFPETVLSASPSPENVVAGPEGALLLYADRMSAHELLATCPPFIELLAGA